MELQLTWDQDKRQRNFTKHGLDFAQAGDVLQSTYCLNLLVQINGEERIVSFAYVLNKLCVLTLVHTYRHDQIRIISFRKASQKEATFYFEWLASEGRQS
ncbi:MAG: BrnT family toxin [Limnohabitans sp.]